MKKYPKTVIAASCAVGAAVMVVVFGLFGFAGYSVFSGQTGGVTSSVSSGIVKVSLSGTGSSESLGIGASNIAPGDTMEREVELTNSGTSTIGTVTLAVTPTNSSDTLYSSSTSGLQFSALTCSAPWASSSLPDGGYSYSCSGTQSTVVGPEPVANLASGIALPSSLSSIAPNATEPFVVELSFPSSATNTEAGQTESFSWTFTGTQATAGSV